MKEEWRDIPEWEGFYAVSNLGRVKSFDRTIQDVNGVQRNYKGSVMKISKAGTRSVVCLQRNGKSITLQVSQLVLIAFVGANPEGLCALHRDDNKDNNKLSNLYYGTAQDNADDREANGLTAKGSKQGCAKLVEEDIPAIHNLKNQGLSLNQIARIFHVSKKAILCVIQGKTWKHAQPTLITDYQ